MSGRPDYDAGDLVVHVGDPDPIFPPVGSVWRVESVHGPERGGGWGVRLVGFAHQKEWGFDACEFRKIDPRPPEFWTGQIEADQPAKVDA